MEIYMSTLTPNDSGWHAAMADISRPRPENERADGSPIEAAPETPASKIANGGKKGTSEPAPAS
jgi:hypothetical protein